MTKNFDKEALKAFKEYKGGPKPELMEYYKYTNRLLKAVREAIKKQGKKTVPEIIEVLGSEYKPYEIYFAVTALRRYEGLEMIDRSGEYPVFAFKE